MQSSIRIKCILIEAPSKKCDSYILVKYHNQGRFQSLKFGDSVGAGGSGIDNENIMMFPMHRDERSSSDGR